MNYILQQLTGKKAILFASLSGAVIADLFISLMLLGYGMPVSSYIIPLLLTVIDVAFLLLSVFTNFKFAYSVKYTVVYSDMILFGTLASMVSKSSFRHLMNLCTV